MTVRPLDANELVPAQIEAHAAYKARQARLKQAANNVQRKPTLTRRSTARGNGHQTPIFPWPKPVFEPVYRDHNAHVITYRTDGISFDRIKHDALVASGLAWHQIISSRRDFAIVRWRQAICYAAREMAGMSLPEIGRMVGNKDHTTVLHAVRKVEECRSTGSLEEIVGPTGLRFFVRTDYNKKPGFKKKLIKGYEDG